MALTIGIDIGTTTICGVVRDSTAGRNQYTVTRPNPGNLSSRFSFQKLQDPEAIRTAADAVLNACLDACGGHADAIGLSGQMHGILYVDSEGKAVSPLYTWQDESGGQRRADGWTYAEFFSRETGYPASSGYGAVTLFNHAENGMIPASASRICTIHDYLAMCWTGVREPLVHASDAASFGGYSITAGTFDLEALEKAGMPTGYFPQTTRSCAAVGKYRGTIPVAVAIGDNQASFLGSAGKDPGSILLNIGTGSQISGMTSCTTATAHTEVRPFLEDTCLLVGSSLCGGRAYAALERFFRLYREPSDPDEREYARMEQLALEWENREETLAVSTQFCGTRTNPEVRGQITGISLDNFTPGALIVGVIRGILDELADIYEEMKTVAGTEKPVRLIGSGNGLRKNPVMQRLAEQRFGMPLILCDTEEEAASGAAVFAEELLVKTGK